jgi:hypothetical protein
MTPAPLTPPLTAPLTPQATGDLHLPPSIVRIGILPGNLRIPPTQQELISVRRRLNFDSVGNAQDPVDLVDGGQR